jgi:hypothetical protein
MGAYLYHEAWLACIFGCIFVPQSVADERTEAHLLLSQLDDVVEDGGEDRLAKHVKHVVGELLVQKDGVAPEFRV